MMNITTQKPVSPASPLFVEEFGLSIEQRDGETAVVLAGELDLYRAPEIERALVDAAEPGRILVVDLRAVTFLDSTMLALLIAADRRQRDHGGETPMSAFEVTGLDRRLSISGAT
jgi:anti-anti-sigma factor